MTVFYRWGMAYRVDSDGWCAELACWVIRDPESGRLVFIPLAERLEVETRQ